MVTRKMATNNILYMREWRRKHIDRVRQLNREWKKNNRERVNYLNIKERDKLKYEVFSYYGKGSICCCQCGYDDIRALAIDHENNDGANERRRLFGDRKYAGTTFYRWLRKNNYPIGYQILCCNCNWIKKLEYQKQCQKI